MIRLSFIFIVILGLFSSSAWAVQTCPSKPRGKVNIIWSSDAVKYNFSKSQHEMDRMEIDTENPYDRSVKTHVGGLMSGGIGLKSEINVATLTYPRSKVTCQWVGSMDIEIAIDPTIYIAREHKKGSCKHNAILEHEMKHVHVDREIVKKYAPAIKAFMERAMVRVGMVGPKPENRASLFQDKIVDFMDGQLKIISQKMYDERRVKQQAIDSLEEYERVSNLCR